MTPLDTLIERVRGLTGPDREVDADVFQFIGGDEWDEARRLASRPSGCPPAMAIAGARKYAPDYTASLDAVVSLIERELPGHGWFVDSANCAGVHEFDGPVQRGNTPALALLLAFLTAMKEKGQ